jgi:small GTP-binding protein
MISNFRFVVLGQSSVGKSSLIATYNQNKRSGNIILVDNNKITLTLADTNGEMNKNQFENEQFLIFMFDVGNRSTLDWVELCVQDIQQTNIIKVLVANKCDLPDRDIDSKEGLTIAKRHGMLYYEVSAKAGDGVEQLIKGLVRIFWQKMDEGEILCNDEIQKFATDDPLKTSYQSPEKLGCVIA